ncbi:hypothetical protein P8882_23260 [Bacillus haynesii]|nr:hypothetical protein [Bacillus haynesii]
MKKTSKIILFALSVLVVFIFFIGSAAFADDASNKVQPQDVKQGGITLDSKRYSYDQYDAVTDVESSWNPFSEESINKNLNSLASITFGLTKMISSLVDTGLDWLYNVEVVNKFADRIGQISTILWENLYAAFGVLLFVIAVLYIFFQYLGQKSSMGAGKTTVRLITVIVVAFVWFANVGWFLKVMNNWSAEAQGLVMKAGNFVSNEQEIPKGQELEGSIALLRNQYFDISVYKPYLTMNYGTTDEAKLTKDDKDRITNLLEYKLNKEGYEGRKKIATSEANELGNTMMGQAGIPKKVGISIFSLIFAVILGVPLLLVAFLNFVVQILVLAISLILPLSCVISFLPNFANSAWYAFGRLISTFLMKAFIGIILLFTFLIINITGEMIPMDTPDLYMLNAFVTAVAIILMIVYRDKVIEFITAGKVVSVDAGMAKSAYDKTIRQPAEKATKMAKTAASAYIAGGAAAAAQRAQDRKENRETGEENDASANAVTSNTDDVQDRSELRSSQEDSSGKVVNMSDYKDSRQERTDQSNLQENSEEQRESTHENSSGAQYVGKAELNRDEVKREPQQIDQPTSKAEPLNREQYRTSQDEWNSYQEDSPRENSSYPQVKVWDENVRQERRPQSNPASQSNVDNNDLASLAAMEPPMDEHEKQISQNPKPSRVQPTGTEERRSERRQVQEQSENHLPDSPNRARGE